jgi:hypothetical protein
MQPQKIYIGGWFQRTTLHLSEIYDFLKNAASPLALDKSKLKSLQKELKLKYVEMKVDDLEYIEMADDQGITIKIFEDGLMVLGKELKSIDQDIKILTSYYEDKLSKSLNYIFSLGAPVPKELANIKNIYPYFLVFNNIEREEIKKYLKYFKQEKYFEIITPAFEIHRGGKLYVINNKSEKIENIERFIQEQIFLREFKGQLHRYLNLHRIIWEKIAEIKERGEIRGSEIAQHKSKIEGYGKTINLIDARISQMNTYIHTREAIVKNSKEFANFSSVLEYKYKTLVDTQDYVKDIWLMTKNYVDSAQALFTNLLTESTGKSVRDLTIITSMGVGATLMGLLTQKTLVITRGGLIYFLALLFIGYFSNKIMKAVNLNRNYKIKDVKFEKNIE